MNPNTSAPIGQANSLPVAVNINPAIAYIPAADPTGTAFNAICPRMDATIASQPMTGPVEIVNTPPNGPFVTKPVPDWHALPICGLVEIINDKWEPKNSRDLPPSPTQGMGMELSAQFCIAFNQSGFARQRRRWAVLTNRGTCLILTGIPAEQRPLNPCDFPPCVQQRLAYPEVEAIAEQRNADRYKLARIPRNWTVALRRADQAEDTPVGGVTC